MVTHLKSKQEVSCDLWQANSFQMSVSLPQQDPVDFKESVNNLFLCFIYWVLPMQFQNEFRLVFYQF